MSVINSGLGLVQLCFFTPPFYDLLPHSNELTSYLPQMGVFPFAFCLCGAAIAIPCLAFVSFVIGSIVYAIRKRKVDSEIAKTQATLVAVISFVLLAVAGFALVAYEFSDLYIP